MIETVSNASYPAAAMEALIGWLISTGGFQRDVAVNIVTDIVLFLLLSVVLYNLVASALAQLRKRLRRGRMRSILAALNNVLERGYDLVSVAEKYGVRDTLEQLNRPLSTRDVTFDRAVADELLRQFISAGDSYLRAHTEMYQLIDIGSSQLNPEDIDPLGSVLAVTGVIRTEIETGRNRLDRLVVGQIVQGETIATEKLTGLEGAKFAALALASIRRTIRETRLPTHFGAFNDVTAWHNKYQRIERAREHDSQPFIARA